jgi:hypothetical protein
MLSKKLLRRLMHIGNGDRTAEHNSIKAGSLHIHEKVVVVNNSSPSDLQITPGQFNRPAQQTSLENNLHTASLFARDELGGLRTRAAE